jgi:hypothetical protein
MSGATRLQREIAGLQKTVAEACKNPFLPAAARDAIAQAGYVIVTLANELEQLRAQISTNGETVNGQLLEMRQALARHNIDVVL